MIKILTDFLIASLFLATVSLPGHAADKYILDDHHTYVLWHIDHLGFSTQVGKWYAKGYIVLDQENPKNSKVDASIDIASIATGLPDLDEHLKGPLFFDVKKYPNATFVSQSVDVLNKNSAKVNGVLTLHGISKPVTLFVTLNKMGKNFIDDKMSVGLSAKTKLKRSDFGISTLLPSLGDEVSIEIGAEAYKANS